VFILYQYYFIFSLLYVTFCIKYVTLPKLYNINVLSPVLFIRESWLFRYIE